MSGKWIIWQVEDMAATINLHYVIHLSWHNKIDVSTSDFLNEETSWHQSTVCNNGQFPPDKIGAIDSTHAVKRAPSQDEAAFINRKPFQSVGPNDAIMTFTNVVASFNTPFFHFSEKVMQEIEETLVNAIE